ncbi:MAG: sensor histidine kinase, partial [Caldilineae bacterium]
AEYLSEVVEDEEELAMLRSSVEAILEGGRRLQNMIEKFLLLADIQQRQELPDRVQAIRLNELVQTTVTDYAGRAEEVGLTLLPSLSREDVVVLGDVHYLQSALKYLLDNALLYRRPDSARVWVSVETDENQDYMGIRVEDEGPGIPEEHLDRLRQPFEQVDRTSRTTPGAGLSLAVVHHIARLHGGYLQIESALGEGSAFTLWLPKPFNSARVGVVSGEGEVGG